MHASLYHLPSLCYHSQFVLNTHAIMHLYYYYRDTDTHTLLPVPTGDEGHKGIVSFTLSSTGAKSVSLLIIQFNGLR